MGKSSDNLIAGYFTAERKGRVLKLLSDLKEELKDLPDPSKKTF